MKEKRTYIAPEISMIEIDRSIALVGMSLPIWSPSEPRRQGRSQAADNLNVQQTQATERIFGNRIAPNGLADKLDL